MNTLYNLPEKNYNQSLPTKEAALADVELETVHGGCHGSGGFGYGVPACGVVYSTPACGVVYGGSAACGGAVYSAPPVYSVPVVYNTPVYSGPGCGGVVYGGLACASGPIGYYSGVC